MEQYDDTDDNTPLAARLLFLGILAFILYACFTPVVVPVPKPKPVLPPVYPTGGGGGGGGDDGNNGGGDGGTGGNGGLQPPLTFTIGISRAYPTSETYDNQVSQMAGGESKFWFYGKENQNPYPTGDWVTQANQYTTIDLPTHAINARAGSDGQHPEYDTVVPKIEYTIKDSTGNVVMYCKDTKGGFHPSFNPNKRGNNHPKESQRYLPFGTYTIEFKNLTESDIEVPLTFTFNRSGGAVGEYFQETVNKGQTVTKTLNLVEQSGNSSMYKLNCNYLP